MFRRLLLEINSWQFLQIILKAAILAI